MLGTQPWTSYRMDSKTEKGPIRFYKALSPSNQGNFQTRVTPTISHTEAYQSKAAFLR